MGFKLCSFLFQSFFFFNIFLLFSFYMPGFLVRMEMGTVSCANKETSKCKGTGLGESVDVGGAEGPVWWPPSTASRVTG